MNTLVNTSALRVRMAWRRMDINRTHRQIRSLFATRGVPKAVAFLIQKAFGRAGNDPEIPQQEHPFDLEHGVDTGGVIAGVDLASGHKNDIYNLAYYGTPPSLFAGVMFNWKRNLPPNPGTEDYTFVDVGAGKGRAVLLASELFDDVTGIELSPDLAATASANIRKWRTAGRGHDRMRILQQDATEFVWPQTPLVVWLFNPFGARVLERMTERLLGSFEAHPRPIDILYVKPEFAHALRRFNRLQPVWSGEVELSDEDRRVDAFGSRAFVCEAWRLSY